MSTTIQDEITFKSDKPAAETFGQLMSVFYASSLGDNYGDPLTFTLHLADPDGTERFHVDGTWSYSCEEVA